jgi:hypothetical protein
VELQLWIEAVLDDGGGGAGNCESSRWELLVRFKFLGRTYSREKTSAEGARRL